MTAGASARCQSKSASGGARRGNTSAREARFSAYADGVPKPQVRVAGEEDGDTVAGLMIAFRDWLGYSTPGDGEIGRVVDELLRDPNTDYLVGSAGGEPAGVCQLRYRLCVWTGADDCWLEDLFVRDEARGAGLGRALVQPAFARARPRNCRRIDLDVNEETPDAVTFYERMGFDLEPKAPG